MIEFGEHQSMKRIVHRGCDFGGNDAVSLSVDEQNARGGINLAQIFGYAQFLPAPRGAVFTFDFRRVARPQALPPDRLLNSAASHPPAVVPGNHSIVLERVECVRRCRNVA